MSYEIRLDIVGREDVSKTIEKAGKALQLLQQNANLVGGEIKKVNIKFAEAQKTVGWMGTGLEKASRKIGFAGFIISWSLGRMARSFGDLSKIMDLVWLPLVPEFQRGIIESSLRIANFSRGLVEAHPSLKTLAGAVGTIIPYFEILGSILSPVGAMGLGLDYTIKGFQLLGRLPEGVTAVLEIFNTAADKVGTAIYHIFEGLETAYFEMDKLWLGTVRPFFEGLGDKIGEALAPIGKKLKDVGGWFKEHVWDKAVEHLDNLETYLGKIPNKIETALSTLANKLSDAGEWFNTNILKKAKDYLVDAADSLMNFLAKIPDKVATALSTLADKLSDVAGWFDEKLLRPAIKWLSLLWDKLADIAADISDIVLKAFGALVDWVRSLGDSQIILAIKTKIYAAARWLANAADAVAAALMPVIGWAALAVAAAIGILAAAWILSANAQEEANQKLLEGTELTDEQKKANEELADSMKGLGGTVPTGGGEEGGFQHGGLGVIGRTGRYMMHAGEPYAIGSKAMNQIAMGGLNVNIYGATDPNAVARQVEQTLLRFVRRRRGF